MDHLNIVRDAVALVKPSIELLFERTNRKELHIVVMDPRLKPWESTFEDAILYEESIQTSKEWSLPFGEFARNKAQQAWRGAQPNLVTQTLHPSSLRDDDLSFYGSFVYGDIVVACSGVEQWYDMLISSWIALAFEQLAIANQHNNKAS